MSADSHVSYPDLGDAAPKVAIVFDTSTGPASRAAIYVLDQQRWVLAHHGPYTRGALLSGRGGVGNRFRLITIDEGFADLLFVDGTLQLVRAGERISLYPS